MNYKFFPENLIEHRYDEDITWFVVDKRDFEWGIFSGPTFSSFSVAIQYCRENPDMNFVICEL